jgi:Spy/CpxP family protein refolding chaperone
MRLLTTTLVALAFSLSLAQHTTHDHNATQHKTDTTSPYLEQLSSPVRGLSQEEIDGLLAGEGMGYARSAELNGYPGPLHVLDMRNQLNLSPEQVEDITLIFEDMRARAVALGKEIVDAEAQLSQQFLDKAISEESLQEKLEHLGNLYGQLRLTHLQAHLAVTPLLTTEQIATYQTLRGYTQN